MDLPQSYVERNSHKGWAQKIHGENWILVIDYFNLH